VVVGAVLVIALAAWGASALGLEARREASGVVSSTVVEAIPSVGYGLLTVFARTASSSTGPFEISAGAGIFLKPVPPAPVVLTYGADAIVRGSGSTQLVGAAVVPVLVSGTIATQAGGTIISVTNRTGRAIEPAWVFAAGRVQALPSVGETARITLKDQDWQPDDRLQRTEPNHALLLWAFSRLKTDAILKATPGWLVGWMRDPGLALRWEGRVETPLQLVLVPLGVP
jgi:hypothetical protein